MKNSIRRLISLATVLALLILSAAVLSGCYVVKSGKMYKIEGTYQLTSYSGKSDYIAERGMTLYIVIRSDGTGYYAYRDNDTEAHIGELRCSFEADPENSSKYSYVTLNFENGASNVKLGIQAAGLFEISTRLGVTTLQWNNTSDLSQGTHSVYVGFTRVSTATDLSYIDKHF